MEFFRSFRKVVAKNRPFGNISIFPQQFLPFRGGGVPCVPLAEPMIRSALAWPQKIEQYLRMWNKGEQGRSIEISDNKF